MSKGKRVLKLAVMVWAAGLTAGVLKAQSTTEGAIAGTVEDPTSAVIPNATITIHNAGTNADKHFTADSSGYFKAPLLEPGTYSVSVAAPGFAGERLDNVVVEVGKLTEVMPHLATGTTETTVQVSETVPVMNYESPDQNEVLDRAAIDGVPVQNRRWSALALEAPGVVADSSGFGLVSVRGLSTLLNNIEIDGADDNQAYYSEERGRTREAYSTSENAVREFEVNTGVYSAQFGRAAGGVINSVTRSGTNDLHGELLFNDLDRGFGAYDPGSVSPSGAPLKPKDLRKIYDASLGGKLIKNKLFWFYTYDQQTHINPGIAKVRSFGAANGSTVGSFLEQPDPTVTNCTDNASTGAVTVTGASAHTALDAQVCALALRRGLTYANGAAYYNAGVTALTGDLGQVPRVGYQEINTPKLDYQINDKERVSVLFHRLRWDAPGDVQTSTSANYAVDAFGEDFVKLDYGLTKLDSVISSNLSNEVLYQYSRELDDEGQQPYSQYTLNNLVAPGQSAGGLVNGPGGTIPYINLNQSNYGFYLGSPYYSYRQALPDERKWQVEDILYWSRGNHSIRFGGDFVHNNDRVQQEPYYFGNYSYANIANYLSDLGSKGATGSCNAAGSGVGTAAAGRYDCYSSMYQEFGPEGYAISTMDYAGFVQDNWKVSPRLTLELGLRYDFEQLPTPSANLTTATGSFVPYAGLNNSPSDRNNYGPRAGFAYDLYGNGGTVLRGGYGLYYGRILNGTVLNSLFGTGSPNSQFQTASIFTNTPGAPTFPNPLATGPASKPSSFFLAPNLQNPAVHEFDLILQQQVGKGTVASFTYVGALSRTLPNFLDVNLAQQAATSATITVGAPTTTAFGTGPLPVGAQYTVQTFATCSAATAGCTNPTGYLNPNFTNITEVISNITANYSAFTAEIQNRSIKRVQFDFNYTWSHALDYNQNATATTSTNNWLNPYAAARQNYGISQFNVGNRFVGYVLYTFPGVSAGNKLKYVANGWTINDTFQMQNGLPYSANLGTSGTSKVSSGALNTGTWDGVPSVTYIPVLGLNTFQVPRAIVDDVRLQKAFPIRERYTLQLNADMYNAANHQNFSSGDVTQTAYNFTATAANASTVTYSPRTAINTGFGSHTSSNDSGFLYTPREFQIQARLEF